MYHSKTQQPWQCQHIVSPLVDVKSASAAFVLHVLLRPVVPASDGGAEEEGANVALSAPAERSAATAAAGGNESWRSTGAEGTSMCDESMAGTLRDTSADGASSNNDDDVLVDDEALADDDASADEGSSPCRESSEANDAPTSSCGGAASAAGAHASGAAPSREGGAAHNAAPRVQAEETMPGAKRPTPSDPPKPPNLPIRGLTTEAVQAMMLANLESRTASASATRVHLAAENGVVLTDADAGVGGHNGANAWDARRTWGLQSHQLLQTQSADLSAPMSGIHSGIHPFCNYSAGQQHHAAMMGGLALANLQPPTSIALERAVGMPIDGEHGLAGHSAQGAHQDAGSNNSDDGSGSGSNGGSGSGSGNSAATTIACAQRSSGAGSSSGRVPPFLTKLYTIVDEAQPEDYAAWCADGNAFRITDPQKFADRCLPRFFKHNKLGSFQQQLLTYGFTRVPNSSCLDISAVWQHPLFRRGRPGQLELIQRATSRRTPGGQKEADEEGAAEEAPQKDGASATEELPAMQAHLGKLATSLADLHEELRAARAVEMRALDALVHRLHKRLRSEPPPTSALAAPADSNSESRPVPTALAP